MRGLLIFLFLQACSYREPHLGDDGGPPPDMPHDSSAVRTRSQLIGAWAFDETSGLVAHDTSGTGNPVDLTASDVVMWSGNGTLTVMAQAPGIVVSSALGPHLDADCSSAHAVTLEAWVFPVSGAQGSASAPVVVAGLSSSVVSRNISILQAGDHWLGRVRTNTTGTTYQDGTPDLLPLPGETVVPEMTHIVLVADATVRALYVNNVKVADTPAEGPLGWDGGYKMVLANEPSLYRPWSGTFAMVALYDRALTVDDIKGNYDAGPTATP